MALAGLLIVTATWLHYLWLIPQEAVPARPVVHLVAMILGGSMALLGISTVGTAVLAANAVVFALLFGWLLTQAPIDDGELIVAVGEPLPAFKALDHTGNMRSSTDWQGRPLLLKFYRGHW